MARWVPAGAVLLLAGLAAFSQACPTLAVVIPETVIIQRIPRPIPDPAGETAAIRKFLNYGFNVLDLLNVQLLWATPDGLAKSEDLARRDLAGDQVAIRELAGRYGMVADTLVVGEAVSTVEVVEALRIPGRAQVEGGLTDAGVQRQGR